MSARGSGLLATTTSLVLCTIGAGILSFPYAALQSGIAMLVPSTIGFSLLAAYMDLILAEFAGRLKHVLPSRTYVELVLRVLGPRHYYAALAQVLVGMMGTLVGFTCVMADLSIPVVTHLCSLADPSSSAAICSVLSSRTSIIMLFSVCIALPLAAVSRIHSLRVASAIAVLAVIAVVVVVVDRGAQPGSAAADLPVTPLDGATGICLMLPIVVYAVGNHVQCVTIFLECEPSAQRAFHVPVLAAFAAISALYIITGVFGVAAFGDAVLGDILLNFALGDSAANFAKVLMALHVAVVVPVNTVPLRRTLSLALRPCADSVGCLSHDGHASGAAGRTAIAIAAPPFASSSESATEPLLSAVAGLSGFGVVDAAARGEHRLAAGQETKEEGMPRICGGCICSRSVAVQTAGLVIGAGLVAIAFPQVNVVFGLLGATLGVTCMWFYPALFLLVRAREVEALAAADAPRSQEDAAATRPTPQYTPSSPFWLRAQAACLLVLSAAVVVLGTSVYVWNTWVRARA